MAPTSNAQPAFLNRSIAAVVVVIAHHRSRRFTMKYSEEGTRDPPVLCLVLQQELYFTALEPAKSTKACLPVLNRRNAGYFQPQPSTMIYKEIVSSSTQNSFGRVRITSSSNRNISSMDCCAAIIDCNPGVSLSNGLPCPRRDSVPNIGEDYTLRRCIREKLFSL